MAQEMLIVEVTYPDGSGVVMKDVWAVDEDSGAIYLRDIEGLLLLGVAPGNWSKVVTNRGPMLKHHTFEASAKPEGE